MKGEGKHQKTRKVIIMRRSKNNYTVRASRFIHQLSNFLDGSESDPRDYDRAVSRFNRAYHRHVVINWGMTRIVFITSDYVVKVDYGKNGDYWGNCESEYEIYLKAVEDGYSYLLAKITPCIYNNRVWYIMPRVNGIGRTENNFEEYFCGDEYEWLMNHIADMHNENYGWKDHKPILIDYACGVYDGDESD